MEAIGEDMSDYGVPFSITRLSRTQAQEKISASVPDFSVEFKSSVRNAKRAFAKGWHLPKTGMLCLSKSESDLAGESIYFFCSPKAETTTKAAKKAAKSGQTSKKSSERTLWTGELRRCTTDGKEWLLRDFVLKPGKLHYYHKNELKSNSFTICGRTEVQKESEIDGQLGLFMVVKLNNNEDANPILLDAINERRRKLFMKAMKEETMRLRQGMDIDKFWESHFEVSDNRYNKHA